MNINSDDIIKAKEYIDESLMEHADIPQKIIFNSEAYQRLKEGTLHYVTHEDLPTTIMGIRFEIREDVEEPFIEIHYRKGSTTIERWE